MPDLHARHFLAELDFTRDEWAYLLDLSAELKQAKRERREPQRLVGRNIVLIFEDLDPDALRVRGGRA